MGFLDDLGLLARHVPGDARNALKGLLGDMPLTKALRGESDVSANGLKNALMGMQVGPDAQGSYDAAMQIGPQAMGGLLGTFAGVSAKTANKDLLAVAQKLDSSGVDRTKIWDETGWFKGPEGKWRFEIDDSAATAWNLPNDVAQRRGTPAIDYSNAIIQSQDRGLRYNDVVQHPPLYAAYEDFPNKLASVRPMNGGQRGELEGAFGILSIADHLDPVAAKSTALHEMQHAVQKREGFGRGGNPDGMLMEWERDMARLPTVEGHVTRYQNAASTDASEAIAKKSPIVDEAQKWAKQQGDWTDSMPLHDKVEEYILAQDRGYNSLYKEWSELRYGRGRLNPDERYRHLAGEAEARAVQTRMDFDATKRKQVPPWESYDIPWDQLIVR